MKKQLFFTLTLFCSAFMSFGQSFTFNGIQYSFNNTSPETVSVAQNPGTSGNVIIPETVSNDAGNYSVTSIGISAFQSCNGLTSVTIPNSITSIGSRAFQRTGLTSVNIPNSVTTIDFSAFRGCTSLTSITIPNSVTSIADYAFSTCEGLTSVDIPDSVTSIGDSAFDSCFNLTFVTIPNNVTSIGPNAFANSGLTSVTIPNSVTSIANSTFAYCYELTSVIIPNSVTSIGNYAFYDCLALTSVIIPNSVTSIGVSAFGYCKGLVSIIIPSSVTSIKNSAFETCIGLTSVTIPSSVISIGNSAFSDCSGLTSLTIPSSVISIGNRAFSACSGLTSLTIPDSVNSIGNFAFAYCSGLKSVTISRETPPVIDSSVFNSITLANVDLYVPATTLVAYEAALVWTDFNIIQQLTATQSQTNVSCNGLSDGSATVVVSGGTAPYTYSWSNGETGVILGGLTAGTYTCVITDAKMISISQTYTITQPDAQPDNVTVIAACDSFAWFNNENIYTQSGTYTGTTTNCVTEKLVLTIIATPVIAGNANQNFNVTDTLADIVVNPTNVVWYASLADANAGTSPLVSTQDLVNNTTYYAVATGTCPSLPFEVLVNTTLSNNSFNNNLNIDLYPNPSNGIINLKLPKDLQIEIYNNLGQMLSSEKMLSGSNSINIYDKPTGVYFLKANDGNNVSTYKIIKN